MRDREVRRRGRKNRRRKRKEKRDKEGKSLLRSFSVGRREIEEERGRGKRK
jgi:hypothetical protein